MKDNRSPGLDLHMIRSERAGLTGWVGRGRRSRWKAGPRLVTSPEYHLITPVNSLARTLCHGFQCIATICFTHQPSQNDSVATYYLSGQRVILHSESQRTVRGDGCFVSTRLQHIRFLIIVPEDAVNVVSSSRPHGIITDDRAVPWGSAVL